MWPSPQEFRDSAWPIARSSVIGFVAGLLPGSGSTLASITAYFVEKRVSTHPERFGRGAIEGVAAAETANNAATGGALIPLLTLGIPGSGTTAVLMGALLMFGIRPGPLLFTEQSDLVWTVIASLYVSNVMLLALNLPLIRIFVRILDIPPRYLMPMILALAAVGGFAANNGLTDVGLVFAFGVLGYFMRLTEYLAGGARAGLRHGRADGAILPPGSRTVRRGPYGIHDESHQCRHVVAGCGSASLEEEERAFVGRIRLQPEGF